MKTYKNGEKRAKTDKTRKKRRKHVKPNKNVYKSMKTCNNG